MHIVATAVKSNSGGKAKIVIDCCKVLGWRYMSIFKYAGKVSSERCVDLCNYRLDKRRNRKWQQRENVWNNGCHLESEKVPILSCQKNGGVCNDKVKGVKMRSNCFSVNRKK